MKLITTKNTNYTHKLCLWSTMLILACSMTIAGCKGPSGDDGSQGPEGPKGPSGAQGKVGPAGDDGSVMLAGTSTPDTKNGEVGDYYLNKSNGKLYGPKKESDWGSSVGLQGATGSKGDDGAKGSKGDKGDKGDAGEDGSQILKNNATPTPSDGVAGDYWLDTKSYTLYGPKSSVSGWGSGFNFKTKVFGYYLPSHDFSSNAFATYYLSDVSSKAEMLTSSYMVYLNGGSNNDYYFYMPGYGSGGNSEYRVYHIWDSSEGKVKFYIKLENGPGEEYNLVLIFRIPLNKLAGGTKAKKTINSGIPKDLDINNYHKVAKYYGFE